MTPSLSLWEIETELAELLNAREELIELGEDLGPIEQAIAEYVKREIAKVDGIRGFIKHSMMMAAAAEAEAQAQIIRRNLWEGRIERLKDFCRRTMEAMTWTEGKPRRIDGKLGSLLLKTNGGKQEVVITKADLLPEELVQYEGRISGQAWGWLRSYIGGDTMKLYQDSTRTAWEHWSGRQDVQMERVPHKGRIAEALSRPCPICDGKARISNGPKEEQCPECDGSGKARVPGAHFAPRGHSVIIR